MSLQIAFWVLYIVAAVFGGYLSKQPAASPRFVLGANVLHFALLGILGWQVFGSAIHR